MKDLDPERIEQCRQLIRPIYDQYTGHEIAEAIKLIRQELDKEQELARIESKITELEETLEIINKTK